MPYTARLAPGRNSLGWVVGLRWRDWRAAARAEGRPGAEPSDWGICWHSSSTSITHNHTCFGGRRVSGALGGACQWRRHGASQPHFTQLRNRPSLAAREGQNIIGFVWLSTRVGLMDEVLSIAVIGFSLLCSMSSQQLKHLHVHSAWLSICCGNFVLTLFYTLEFTLSCMNRYKLRTKSQSVGVNAQQTESNISNEILMRFEKMFIVKEMKRVHQLRLGDFHVSQGQSVAASQTHTWTGNVTEKMQGHQRVWVKEG